MNRENVMLIFFQHLDRFRSQAWATAKAHKFGMTLTVLFSFFAFHTFPMEIKSLELPVDGMRWTLETTEGFQNIENSPLSSADGNESYLRQVLQAKGILFHSFYDDILLTNAQLNLGFTRKVDFLWTEHPDFEHEVDLNNDLRSMVLDVQQIFPIVQNRKYAVSLFGAFSYFEVNFKDSSSGAEDSEKFLYNSFSGGIQGIYIFSKIFSQLGYVSYSPVVFYGYELSTVQFLNYGLEFRTETHPVSFTLFYNAKHAFRQEGRTWFNGIRRNMNSTEVGFSFHFNFREKQARLSS